MKNRIILVVLVLFIGLSASAQNSINDYKFVVVPLGFDFLNGKDQYRTSTLMRYLLKNEDFEVYFDEEELPKELIENSCLALYADIIKLRAFLTTKLQIELKDCNGKIIFKSEEGKSKLKAYDKVYSAAIRDAFKSIEFLNYKYNPNSILGSKKQAVAKREEIKEDAKEAKATQAEVERLKKEVQDLKKQKELAKLKSEQIEKQQSEAKKLSQQKLKNQKIKVELVAEEVNSNLLYAQPTGTGFQLVDVTPKVVMVLIKTAAPNVYAIKGKNAIVFKEGDVWFYSEDDTKKILNIKF
ncbi:hypothetical protein [Winogradskyella sp.]|uniref:hypothetical protein n=1 Tax=Winogradskyella sp. TaxID=1883156 RepID=UPI0025E20518|nr:hypothetical protein [Winogradskyella sp.]MBT8245215.1 hypothetical protein [Winogradskyella sp.]